MLAVEVGFEVGVFETVVRGQGVVVGGSEAEFISEKTIGSSSALYLGEGGVLQCILGGLLAQATEGPFPGVSDSVVGFHEEFFGHHFLLLLLCVRQFA